MGGRHYKNVDGENPSVAGREMRDAGAGASRADGTNGSVRPQTGNGAERSRAADPGETAMFIALHEQSKRRSSAATSGRVKPSERAAVAKDSAADEAVPVTLPPLDAGDHDATREDAPSGPVFGDDDAEFMGSGSKEDFYDFNLPYGGEGESSTVTSDGLVRHKHHRKSKGKLVRNCVIGLVAALVVICAVGGFALYRSVKNVQSEATSAVSLVTDIKGKITSGDFSSLADDVDKISDTCASIKAETDGPLWTAATFIPVYGGDISAARTLVSALSDVASNGLSPMASELSQATPGKLIQSGGTINVSALQTVLNSMAGASDVFKRANKEVQGIGNTHIDKVTSLVTTAKEGFSALDGATDAAVKFAPVLPQMLGANGQTRNYLVVAENNVEIRARGGFGGSQGVISVTDGQMNVGDFKAATSIDDDRALAITDEENQLFNSITKHMGTNSGDALYTPDFPRAASLVSQLWEIDQNQHVDGVIAMDPVFLQYLLGLVGNVSLPDGTVVDGSNAAKVLMHDVYWNYPVAETDGIFAAVANAAFSKIMNGIGDADMMQLVSVFQKGCSEGRFIAWMSDSEEEAALKDLGIAANLPDASDTSTDPTTGVYVDNYSYSKIDWYLNLDSQVGIGTKSGDGTSTYQVTTTLTNTLKKGEVASLPSYVASSMPDNRGDERLGVFLYAPAGGSISNVQVNGSNLTLAAAKHDGLDVQFGIVDLLPEETCTITYTVTTPKEADGKDLKVSMTPTCQVAREGDTE